MAELKNGKISLRIATYNIAAGRYNRDLRDICNEIIKSDADIVGLQEVDINTSRCGNIDMLAEIARLSRYEYSAFVRAIDYDGGEYGTAVLSRYPLTRVEILPLKCVSPAFEMRSVGITEIDILGQKINFLNTHISHESKEARNVHFEHLASIVEKLDSYIMTGDFNTEDFSAFLRFPYSKIVNNKENRFPSFTPTSQAIDNIVMSSDWHHENAILGKAGCSDHRLLVAELKKEL